MTKVLLYGLKNCSTCVKATKWLVAHGFNHEFIDYRAKPVDPQSLTTWADQIGWEKLVNRSSMAWRNLTDEQKTPAAPQQWLDLIAAHPTLIKRPVAVDEEGLVSVGFSEKQYNERFIPSTPDAHAHAHSNPA